MATIRLPTDFKEFLELLNSEKVKYLLVGGLAVGHYGYPRATGDMDIWVGRTAENAKKLVTALKAFGFGSTNLTEEMFQVENKVVRMGVPPLRIDILTSIDGVEFAESYATKRTEVIDGVSIDIISLSDLKANKSAAGRPKDLDDLAHLPQAPTD